MRGWECWWASEARTSLLFIRFHNSLVCTIAQCWGRCRNPQPSRPPCRSSAVCFRTALNRRRMGVQVAHLALYNEVLTPLDIRMLFTHVRSLSISILIPAQPAV